MGFNLFKTLGGAVTGFLGGGPVGALSGAIRAQQPRRVTTTRSTGLGRVFGGGDVMVSEFGPPGAGGAGFQSSSAAAGCPTGFRLNKSTYVTRGGGTSKWPVGLQVHQKGTTCVRRRRMNPGNGKAAVKATRRLVGFYRLSQRVAKQLRRAASAAKIGRGRGQRRLPPGQPSVQVIDTD